MYRAFLCEEDLEESTRATSAGPPNTTALSVTTSFAQPDRMRSVAAIYVPIVFIRHLSVKTWLHIFYIPFHCLYPVRAEYDSDRYDGLLYSVHANPVVCKEPGH